MATGDLVPLKITQAFGGGLAQTKQHELHNLCFEAGIACTVVDGPIHPHFLLRKVDTVIGLLSLVPGSQRGVTA